MSQMTTQQPEPFFMPASTSTVLEEALRAGCRMHAFSSGGGLRVVRIERSGKSVAYGEHPYINEALRIAAEDYKAGGRAYQDVYGKIEKEYLTGDPCPNSDLDMWVRKGSTFDAWFEDELFVFELNGLHMNRVPEAACKYAYAGQTVRFKDERGVLREAIPFVFANGEMGASIKDINFPPGFDRSKNAFWYIVKRGEASVLSLAIKLAFAAPEKAV